MARNAPHPHNKQRLAQAPVGALDAYPITSSAATLSWINPTGSTFAGIVIRRDLGRTPPATPTSGTAVAKLSRPARHDTDTRLAASTAYTYAVFAYSKSSKYSVGTDLHITTAPSPVSALKVVKVTSSTVALSWKDPSSPGFAGVLIRRGLASEPPESPSAGTLVARLGPSIRAFTDTDLSPSTAFIYAVFSYDRASENSVPVTVKATTTRRPLKPLNACGTKDTVSHSQTWSPAKATSYQVDCILTVDSGVKLTIEPGTVVKLSGMVLVASRASLIAGGKGAPVVFTSYRDGQVGGAVTGQPPPKTGDYNAGVELEERSSASITNATFLYGNTSVADGFYAPCGTAGNVRLDLTDSILTEPMTIGSCPDRGNARYSLSRNDFEVPATAFAAFEYSRGATDKISMTSNWFDFSGDAGVSRAIWTGLPVGISLSGASTNTFAPSEGTTLVGVGGDVPAGSTFSASLPAGVVLATSSGQTLEADGTVTIGAGTTVGSTATGVTVLGVELKGSLLIKGTAAAPVSLVDDSSVDIAGSGTTEITHAVFTGLMSTSPGGGDVFDGSCAGGKETVDITDSTLDSGVQLGQCATTDSVDINISQNLIERPSGSQFLRFTSSVTDPGELVVTRNTISASSVVLAQPQSAVWIDGWPTEGVALSGADSNRFTGSGTNRVVEVASATIPAEDTWTIAPSSGAVLAPWSGAGYGPGLLVSGDLVLEAGAVVKTEDGDGIEVEPGGSLDADGTSTAMVTFTSIEDGSIDGASNGTGPEVGTPAGKGGNYNTTILANEDTYLNISYAQFRDGLWAVDPPYNVTPEFGGSATITHCLFAEELQLGDSNGTQVGYAATLTNNTWTFDGAPSGQYAAGGRYDPHALQQAVYLDNIDPTGFSLSGGTANTFKGTGAGRVLALLGTTIPASEFWEVSPSTGVVVAPWLDDDYLTNPGIDVEGALILDPGTVVKSDPTDAEIEVAKGGTIDASGVTFTAISDDTIDGDSNGDGSMSKPSMGCYGDAIEFDDVARGSDVTSDLFKYARTAISSTAGGDVSISSDTFESNTTAVDILANLTTDASVSDNTFSGNDVSIESVSTWSVITASPVHCQFLPLISAKGNTFAGGSAPLVSAADYSTIKAELALPVLVKTSPSGWTKHLKAGATDDLTGWTIEPCVNATNPKSSYTAVAIPLDLGT